MATRKFGLGDLPITKLQVESILLEAPEDPEDKAARLYQERWSFFVERLAVYVFGYVFLSVISLYCCYVVARYGFVSPEGSKALPVLTTLFGGVLGVIVGKAAK